MALTPDELRHRQLGRVLLGGYRRHGVEELLNELADSFEDVWRERSNLFDRLQELEAEAAKHHELEALLRSTLMSAERAVRDMKEQAYRESDLIVREAHAESRRVTREAAAEKRRLEDDLIRIRGLLRTALDVVADRPSEEEKQPEAPPVAPPTVEEPGESSIRKIAG
jgi:DivIVA domain-containing protein